MSREPRTKDETAAHDAMQAVEAYLERLERGDAESEAEFLERHASLRNRIEPVLREVRRMFPASTSGASTEKPPTRSSSGLSVGDRVDDYKILERLGEGGFAIVYLAEQERPIRRRVALKIIKPGMDSDRVIARFEAERQALALMDHPGVARVFGAGCTESGHPYFVMEHVPGVSVTEHCERYRLSLKDRLDLFVQICDAVQYSHQKGIIHRDIKPSNVLIVARDGRPAPKIIDFGIAKALHQPLTERTLYTEQGQLIGTPEYMSPEQAEMTAQDVDTRTDIYSLGVLLYELLSGCLPFDAVRLREGGHAEIQRVIHDRSPLRPSSRLERASKEGEPKAPGPDSDGGVHPRHLRGDLDWIVMKALEKDRNRRYDTPEALAADIRRHMRHEPVLAGPPSTLYIVRKFTRRHRTAVAAACLVAISLVASAAVSIRFGFAEARQRRIASVERDSARAINVFFNDLLGSVAPSSKSGRGRDVTMIEVLNGAARRIDEESRVGGPLAETPLVEAALRTTIGQTFRELGKYTDAGPHLERAYELYCRVQDPEHRNSLGAAENIAWLDFDRSEYDRAQRRLESVVEISTRTMGAETQYTLEFRTSLAAVLEAQRRHEDARRIYANVLEAQLRVLEDRHSSTQRTMSGLAITLKNLGRYDEAEALYLELLEIDKEPEGGHRLTALMNLTNVYVMQKRYDEADELMTEALGITKKYRGDTHPTTLLCMSILADVREGQGRLAETEELLIETLELSRESLGLDHQFTRNSIFWLGNFYSRAERYEEAKDWYRKAYEASVGAVGEEHPATIDVLQNLAFVHEKLGAQDEANQYLRKIEEIRGRVEGED